MLLNFRETDLTLGLSNLHESEDSHFASIGFMTQTQLVDEFSVVLVECLIGLQQSNNFPVYLLDGRDLEYTTTQAQFLCRSINFNALDIIL